MFKLLANATVALSLMLSASVAAPAWAGTAHDRKCSSAKHKHAKRAPVVAKSQPARGVTVVDQRKLDVQILSFGP